MEAAIESGIVHDATARALWIEDVALTFMWRVSSCRFCIACTGAWNEGGDVEDWNARFAPAAIRPRAAWRRSKWAVRWRCCCVIWVGFRRTDWRGCKRWRRSTFPLAYAFATARWAIPAEAMLHAYAWSWLENQVGVAMKGSADRAGGGTAYPAAVSAGIPAIVAAVVDYPDDAISNFAPA